AFIGRLRMRAATETDEHVDEEDQPPGEDRQHQPVHEHDDLVDARRVRRCFDGKAQPGQHQALVRLKPDSTGSLARRITEMMNRRKPARTTAVMVSMTPM